MLAGMLARACAFAAVLLAAGNADAQNYPNKPVRMIVPFAAAGPTDIIARLIGQKLAENLGQQFYIENIPGAGGNTGTAMVAKAPHDGYTLLVISTGFVVNPSLYAKVPYDPVKEFSPITLIAASPNVLMVNPEVPAKSVKELIELVRANPGKYSYAQPALGSTPHLSGELFKLTFKLDLQMVPFPGAAPAITSTIAGHTPVAFTAVPPAVEPAKNGKVRALAVMADKRLAALPDVPTFGEAGVKNFGLINFTGLWAPKGTPQAVIDRLQKEIATAMATPDMKAFAESIASDPGYWDAAAFAKDLSERTAYWGKVAANTAFERQ
jgi:tripartite-type tricarboxylate transporter receptor subunit TctC